jgi:hypothetical protein
VPVALPLYADVRVTRAIFRGTRTREHLSAEGRPPAWLQPQRARSKRASPPLESAAGG